jgi:hypothetical protein
MEQALSLTRHDLEAKIVKHCWEDEAFCKAFSTDPVGVFARYLQIPAATLPKILVHEETPGSWHIVLPVKPTSATELSDGELEKVTGGTSIVSIAGTVITFVSLSASAIVTPQEGW